MLKPCPEVVALLHEALEQAKAGRIDNVMLVFHVTGDEWSWAHVCDDVPDLIYAAGTALMEARADSAEPNETMQ